MTVERCDMCGIRLGAPDPADPDDRGLRCAACVAERGMALSEGQLALELEAAPS